MQLDHSSFLNAEENIDVEATEAFAAQQDELAAQLLLARVEALISQGQPRQAVSHILDMTGVEKEQAEEFVTELQSHIFG